MKRITIFNLFFSLVLMSCGGGSGDDNGGGGGGGEPVTPPSAATLIFPENNTECNEGTIISSSQSSVVFRWSDAANADSYIVILTNLQNNQTVRRNASTNSLEITISRGTPYSWQVESRANGTAETAQSSIFRFYNAGEPVDNYAPFPAAVLTPTMGATVNPVSGKVTLSWNGNDIDDDITEYDVFFGTGNPPATILATQSETSLEVDVAPDTVYYWRVRTKDAADNVSTSEVFQFKTN
ncbi:hypothetical protein [Ascidiimonas aurantiaca]|uniref:hypothetical protein n=1 Tax=Ascidiimonas aurantiaca TaxID=1685432 RepID=UPI0030ED1B63